MRASACLLAAALLLRGAAGGSCSHLSNCNGHGTCDSVTSRCACFNGWGSATDIALYKAPDCSTRASKAVTVLRCDGARAEPPPPFPPSPRRYVPVGQRVG